MLPKGASKKLKKKKEAGAFPVLITMLSIQQVLNNNHYTNKLFPGKVLNIFFFVWFL